MGCIERLPFEVDYFESRRKIVSKDIMILSMIEQRSYEIQEMDIVKLTQERIKVKIISAHRLGWVAMSELNDTTVLYGLVEKEIFELLG